MGMFGPEMGTWWVESKKDPRWNKTGEGYGLVTTGGPSERQEWVDQCVEKYGDPPDDCGRGFMKD